MKLWLWILVFVLMGCSRGTDDIPATAGSASNSTPSVMQPSQPPPLAEGAIISGTISVDPSLADDLASTDVVYIIARSAEMPGPPLAVQQLRSVQFPYRYSLTPQDLMIQGTRFEGKVNVVVRLDRDGAAGPPQPGDMEGVYPGNPATVGDQKVDIVINKVF